MDTHDVTLLLTKYKPYWTKFSVQNYWLKLFGFIQQQIFGFIWHIDDP